MGIKYNGQAIKAIKYNGLNIAKMMNNGSIIWTSPVAMTVYDNLQAGWTLSTSVHTYGKVYTNPQGCELLGVDLNLAGNKLIGGTYYRVSGWGIRVPGLENKDFNFTVRGVFRLPSSKNNYVTIQGLGTPFTSRDAPQGQGAIGWNINSPSNVNDGIRIRAFARTDTNVAIGSTSSHSLITGSVSSESYPYSSPVELYMERRGTSFYTKVSLVNSPYTVLLETTQTLTPGTGNIIRGQFERDSFNNPGEISYMKLEVLE